MNVYNVIILDASGSMSCIYNETLASINEVLCGIKDNQKEFPEQRHYVSIVTFRGYGLKGVKTRRDRVPVSFVEPFTENDYRPHGCTPLYDAIGKTLNKIEGVLFPDDKVFVTVITDGLENSSQEYSEQAIRNMVTRLREKGWAIAYIGANLDAVEEASKINISSALNYEASSLGLAEMAERYKKVSKKVARRAMSGCILCDKNDNLFEDMDED